MTGEHAVLEQVFPGRPVAAVETIRRGNTKLTAVVTFEDGESVVVQQSGRPASLRTEVALARAVRDRTAVPVPAVLDSGSVDGTGYAVFERAPGTDLHERFVDLKRGVRRRVARTFGRALASLQTAFSFDAYGPVEADDGEFRATGPADWATFFEEYAREGIDALPDPFADLRGPIDDALIEASLPARPPARLYPWDLRPGNALVADGEVTAVLDWGDPLAAAPGLALAKTEHLVADWYVSAGAREELRAALRDGYRAVRPLPDVPRVYRLVAVVRSAVDSLGEVTRPGYPELTDADAVAFHRERIAARL